ncbi:hypothetical protein GJ688_09825 [Heliobacillus mobilis]|uniref:Uncharacterized protein n=1 Tax=Heliobacterium mobile TaxID=28064 RepID=A0A6I3SKG5_HELMO|nr:hypothetical protein [Heliobacterium mobile]MTV49276.1 hypothetical protein [Heliobacterium mobile]
MNRKKEAMIMREFWKRLFHSKPSVLRDLLPETYYEYIEQSHIYPNYETVYLRLPNGHLVHISHHIGPSSDRPFTVTIGSWRYKKYPKPAASAIQTELEDKYSLNLSADEWVELLHLIYSLPFATKDLACA